MFPIIKKGRIKTTELYQGSPIEVSYDINSQTIPRELEFICRIISPEMYEISVEHIKWEPLFANKKFKFSDTLDVDGFKFCIVNKVPEYYKAENPEIAFVINNVNRLIGNYQSKMNVRLAGTRIRSSCYKFK